MDIVWTSSLDWYKAEATHQYLLVDGSCLMAFPIRKVETDRRHYLILIKEILCTFEPGLRKSNMRVVKELPKRFGNCKTGLILSLNSYLSTVQASLLNVCCPPEDSED